MFWILVTGLWAAMLVSPFVLLYLFLPAGRECPRCSGETLPIRSRILRPFRSLATLRWCLGQDSPSAVTAMGGRYAKQPAPQRRSGSRRPAGACDRPAAREPVRRRPARDPAATAGRRQLPLPHPLPRPRQVLIPLAHP